MTGGAGGVGEGAPRVAFQGEHGAFSEEAARAWFGGEATTIPCRDFREVVERVVRGEVRYGLLPVRNSLVGSVAPARAALAGAAVRSVGEVTLPIRQALLGLPGSALTGIRRAVSHPVALAQCGRFFRAHPWIAPAPGYDTAGAARGVAAGGDPSVAAIAGHGAAARWGLEVLVPEIHDRPDNRTHFVVIEAVTRSHAGSPVTIPASPASPPRPRSLGAGRG